MGGLGPQRDWKKLHNRFSCAKWTNICVKVLCLVIVNVNVTKYMRQEMSNMTDLWLSGVFFQALNNPKFVFGRGSAPRWGAYDAPLQTPYYTSHFTILIISISLPSPVLPFPRDTLYPAGIWGQRCELLHRVQTDRVRPPNGFNF